MKVLITFQQLEDATHRTGEVLAWQLVTDTFALTNDQITGGCACVALADVVALSEGGFYNGYQHFNLTPDGLGNGTLSKAVPSQSFPPTEEGLLALRQVTLTEAMAAYPEALRRSDEMLNFTQL